MPEHRLCSSTRVFRWLITCSLFIVISTVVVYSVFCNTATTPSISMDFLEGSRGVYRPIRVLFDTIIYERALQICWNSSSYKSQIALVMELLRLQQVNQIPSEVTVEEMMDVILEQSKDTLREQLWEFEMEDFDEEEAKPLLRLVWAVNVCNKMRDVEFEAQLLLESPEAVPSNFKHPKVLRMAKDYARILRQRRQEALQSKTISPQEVIFQVVPRVLQGFWALPRRSLLNMPSKVLSQLSVGVTKAVLDQVSRALSTTVERQTNFSRTIRDEIVQSILTEIRQTHPLDLLKSMIKNFAPVLLTEIVDVAVEKICEIFQPQCTEVPAHLTPTVKCPATTPVQDSSSLAVREEKPAASSHTNCAAASCPPAPVTEQLPITVVQAKEDLIKESNLGTNPASIGDLVSTLDPAPLMPPVEQHSMTVLTGEDLIKESSLGTEPTSIREFASTPVPAVPAPLSPLAEAAVGAAVQDGLNKNLAVVVSAVKMQPTSSLVTKSAGVSPHPAPLKSITEPSDKTDVKDRASLQEDPTATTAPTSAVVPLTAPDEPVAEMTQEKGALGFFSWLIQPFSCCFAFTHTYFDVN